MPRLLQLALLFTLAAPASAQADLPGSQAKQITIRAIDGKSGKALAHQRLVIFGGDSQEALRFHQQHFDITTDEGGNAELKLSGDKTHWIQAWADWMSLCQSKPNFNNFSIETILTKGLSAPNTCSSLVEPATPGVFTMYARSSSLREKMAR